jgi:N-glycosidase YbiA
MSRLVVLQRARVGSQGIDTTVKSSQGVFRYFAPTWGMVMDHKNGRMSDRTYLQLYLDILSEAPKTAWRALWSYGLQNGSVTPILCYCAVDKPFCHNQFLVDYGVEKWPNAFCREYEQGPVLFTKDCPTWGFLSNFSSHPFVDPSTGRDYQTVEHYFQAMKAVTPDDHERIRYSSTPHLARQIGRKVQMRSDWNTFRVEIMRRGLFLKFDQHPDIRQKLAASAPRQLVEHAPWDAYWGNGGGNPTAKNMLGKLLMELRKDLVDG